MSEANTGDVESEAPHAVLRAIETLSRKDVIEVRWPVVIFRFAGTLDVPVTSDLLKLMDVLFAQKQVFAIITDMRKMNVPDARVRQLLGAYQKEQQHHFNRWIAGDAHIIGNSMIRGLVTAINWIAPAEHPQGFFGTEEEGLAWVKEQLKAPEHPPRHPGGRD